MDRTPLPCRSVVPLYAACLSVLLPCVSQLALAETLQVRFDMPLVVSCRDVTPEDFAAANPDRRILQAKLEISSLLVSGNEEDLLHYFYRFVSPQQSLRIVDYQPRTTLTSYYEGGIGIEKKREKSKSAGLALTGAWDHVIKATGSGDIGSKDTVTTRYELVAPMESLAASGTLMRGHGVYFKLRATRQTTLEGSKEFVLVFEAPHAWRGDVLQVRCEAFGYDRGVVKQLDEQTQCGADGFLIALHRRGDEQARHLAERYVETALQLRRLASDHRRDIHRRRYPTLLHEVGALFDVVEPKISDAWLDQILLASEPRGETISARLPDQVRTAAKQYLSARQQLSRLRR